MKLWHRLWRDCRGAVAMSEIILINTIVIVGAIAGLTAIRDNVAQQFGDQADAFQSLDQSFTIYSSNFTGGYVDPGPFPVQTPGEAPAGLGIGGAPASGES